MGNQSAELALKWRGVIPVSYSLRTARANKEALLSSVLSSGRSLEDLHRRSFLFL